MPLMSKIYTTEITSDQLLSDNPLHQRLLKPYVAAKEWIKGDLLEVGCGEGRGISHLKPGIKSYTAIDKIDTAIGQLRKRYPESKFIQSHLPPLPFEEAAFDTVVSFQVIEHIPDDRLFLKEIHRVLRTGGVALITTPNRPLSLSRNPWHIREYTAEELSRLAKIFFSNVEMMGIGGNEKVMSYHDRNRESVNRLMRWDILNLQYRLPASLLRVPYDFMNRLNRTKLQKGSDDLVRGITHNDYIITKDAEKALDLFLVVRK